MKRNILLIEPNYKNKYPPIGLMKIATYHRMLGDNVTFFKGNMQDLVLRDITDLCIDKLHKIDHTITWREKRDNITQYIRTKQSVYVEALCLENSKYEFLIIGCLDDYKKIYWKKQYEKEPLYDRIYVTSLFTFYWKITIDTINFAKKLVKNVKELKVGGVTATVLFDDVVKATNIIPHRGLLDKPGILDKNQIIIDTLPLDYSILEETEYKYPENGAYYGYMTRGCIRKCSFCAVPTLEPNYCEYISITERIKETTEKYGEKRNLLLLDNNVLASERFPQIINDIKKAGFVKGATYIEPNQFDIAVKNLSDGINDRAYIRRTFELISELLKKLRGETQQNFYNLLEEHNLLHFDNVTKEKLLELASLISELYQKHNKRLPRLRYVDFNQGVDARLINEDNIKLLSEIPIHPLRIAFDSMKWEKQYTNAVKLAAEHGINHLSNYLLYNEKDHPVELYRRLKINVSLCDGLGINIYSFPMKFHPITGPDRFNRDYLGKHWNRKFIRAVQAVLNATKGKIGKGQSFFEKAFGKDEEEFEKILYMPEPYILYRFLFEGRGDTEQWWNEFTALNEDELVEAKKIIEKNKFTNINELTKNRRIRKVLKHYTVKREDISKDDLNQYVYTKREQI
ncbi:radical SAM protein [Dysgonomonas termitidis]|uniref:Radical SAM protein n=1 Tax=Dysgonomonas termitidis TaxID=1516126 RepID=A0ABV9L2W7_9BACT